MEDDGDRKPEIEEVQEANGGGQQLEPDQYFKVIGMEIRHGKLHYLIRCSVSQPGEVDSRWVLRSAITKPHVTKRFDEELKELIERVIASTEPSRTEQPTTSSSMGDPQHREQDVIGAVGDVTTTPGRTVPVPASSSEESPLSIEVIGENPVVMFADKSIIKSEILEAEKGNNRSTASTFNGKRPRAIKALSFWSSEDEEGDVASEYEVQARGGKRKRSSDEEEESSREDGKEDDAREEEIDGERNSKSSNDSQNNERDDDYDANVNGKQVAASKRNRKKKDNELSNVGEDEENDNENGPEDNDDEQIETEADVDEDHHNEGHRSQERDQSEEQGVIAAEGEAVKKPRRGAPVGTSSADGTPSSSVANGEQIKIINEDKRNGKYWVEVKRAGAAKTNFEWIDLDPKDPLVISFRQAQKKEDENPIPTTVAEDPRPPLRRNPLRTARKPVGPSPIVDEDALTTSGVKGDRRKTKKVTDHENRVHKHKPGLTTIPCEVCEKPFPPCKMDKHMKVHNDANRPFKCSQCPYYFASFRAVEIHEINVHKMAPGLRGFLCPICKQRVDVRSALQWHMYKVHSEVLTWTREKEDSCRASGSGRLVARRAIPEGRTRSSSAATPNKILKSHECTICKIPFRSSGRLKEHLRIHEKQPNDRFNCTRCPSYFKRRCDLSRHENQVHRLELLDGEGHQSDEGRIPSSSTGTAKK